MQETRLTKQKYGCTCRSRNVFNFTPQNILHTSLDRPVLEDDKTTMNNQFMILMAKVGVS